MLELVYPTTKTFWEYWPQVTMIALMAIALFGTFIQHGKQHPPYNIWVTLFAVILEFVILYAGGFFSS